MGFVTKAWIPHDILCVGGGGILVPYFISLARDIEITSKGVSLKQCQPYLKWKFNFKSTNQFLITKSIMNLILDL